MLISQSTQDWPSCCIFITKENLKVGLLEVHASPPMKSKHLKSPHNQDEGPFCVRRKLRVGLFGPMSSSATILYKTMKLSDVDYVHPHLGPPVKHWRAPKGQRLCSQSAHVWTIAGLVTCFEASGTVQAAEAM